MTPTDIFVFGYGSLVNRDTHDFGFCAPAKVTGWRRRWRHTTMRQVAYLTVVPAADQVIDGLIAAVPDADWPALDRREGSYDRLHLDPSHVSHGVSGNITVRMYKTVETNDAAATVRCPILLSYLDCVIKGFLDVFGRQGVADFFASTDGWDAPILNDRKDPRYPRHVELSKSEKQLVDERLAALTPVQEQLQQTGAMDKGLWHA